MRNALKVPESNAAAALNSTSFFIGRAYYNYVGLLERGLADTGLQKFISPGVGHVLFALFQRDDRIIKNLAAQVKLSCSTMTGLVARMQRAGLLDIARDPADRRAFRLKLTPLARTLETRCFKLLKNVNRIMEEGMSAQERRTLKRLLEHMSDNMRKAEEKAKSKNGDD